MARNYLHTLFNDHARALQEAAGSRASYARMEAGDDSPDRLGEKEAGFIAARDSFYMASVAENDWPYLQHRGGPTGFLQVMAGNRLGFADYRGNRQFMSIANLAANPRVSLFLMDYPNRRRLKIIGTATYVDAATAPDLVTALTPPGYEGTPEGAFLIDVVGFDWNCPQHITPRFGEADVAAAIAPFAAELRQLRAENAALQSQLTKQEKNQ
jgi:predicted pyridoxine 5'-phosphate oxidase superfamily flavin-nucleotide-binding protein